MDRPAAILAGAALVAGTAVMLVGAAVPLLTGLGLDAWTADWEQKLDIVATDVNAWRLANALIIIGAVLVAVGMRLTANVLRSLGRPSEASVVAVLFPIGVALEAVNRTANIALTVFAAEARAADDPIWRVFEGLDQWRELMGDLFLVLGTLALIIAGLGFLRAGNSLPGILAISFGAVGFALALLGGVVPAVLFLGTGALGAALLITMPGKG